MQIVFLSLLMLVTIKAYAVDQSVQVDILMSKIINAEKEGRAADALPSMAKLESLEPNLSEPLPEEFHYLYITTLDKAGDHANALRRANIYVEKFGRQGKHYAKVVDIIGRLEEEADKNSQAESARIAAEEIEHERKCDELRKRYCQTDADHEQAYKDYNNSSGEERQEYHRKYVQLSRELDHMSDVEAVEKNCRGSNIHSLIFRMKCNFE
jgi:hypothetical protein